MRIRLLFSGKLLLQFAMLATIVGFVVVLLIANLEAEKRNARNEFGGVKYHQRLVNLFVNVQQHQGEMMMLSRNKLALSAGVDVTRKKVDSNLVELKKIDNQYGVAFKTGQQIRFIVASWEKVKVASSGSKKNLWRSHSNLLQDIKNHMHDIANESGLVTDPDLYSYHLMLLVREKLPDVIENLGVVRGAQGIDVEHITDDIKSAHEISSRLLNNLAQSVVSIVKYADADADVSAFKFADDIAQRQHENEAFIEIIKYKNDRSSPSEAVYENYLKASELITAYKGFYDRASQNVLSRFTKRILKAEHEEALMVLLSIVGMLLLVILVLIATWREHKKGDSLAEYVPRISFATKVSVLTGAVSIVTAVVVGITAYSYGIRWLQASEEAKSSEQLVGLSHTVLNEFDDLNDHATWLGASASAYVLDKDLGITPALSFGVKALMKSHSSYRRVQYIKSDKSFVFSVERNKNDEVVIATKAHFPDVLKPQLASLLVPDDDDDWQLDVFVSDIYPLMGQDKNLADYAFVVSAPVLSSEGEPWGVVAIEINLKDVFERIASFDVNGGQLFVVNSRGEYLLNLQHVLAVNKQGAQSTFEDDYGNVFNKFVAHKQLSDLRLSESKPFLVYEDNSVYMFKPLVYDIANHKKYITLVAKNDFVDVYPETALVRYYVILFVLLVALVSVMVGMYVAGVITRPIRQITDAVDKMGNHYVKVELPTKSRDELGKLARAFDAMMQRVEKGRKELLYTEERTRAVVENAMDGILTIDSSGHIKSFNFAAERMFGYKAHEVIEKNVVMLIPRKGDEYVNDELGVEIKHILIGGRDVEGVRKDGSAFPLQLSVNELVLADARMYTAIIRDITEDKLNERILKQAIEEAEEAAAAKSSFLANMSHELRTPMNGIIGASGLLSKEKLSSKQSEYNEIITTSGETLLALIGDILDLSKIEAGELILEAVPFNLRELVQTTSELLAINLCHKDVELLVNYSPLAHEFVKGDAVRIRQVFFNLVGNAIKFTSTGFIALDVQEISSGEGTVEFTVSVRDTGIGMDELQMERIFDKFNQADRSTTRKYGGTGLGLAISKQLVEMMDGTINVESAPEEGTVFTFSFVLGLDADHVAVEAIELAPLEGKQIVIVSEYDERIGSIYSYLGMCGAMITEAKTSENLLVQLDEAVLDGRVIDLVLVDYCPRHLEITEALSKVVQQPKYHDTSFVQIVSQTDFVDMDELQKVGYIGCLYKPLRMEDLYKVISSVMIQRETGGEITFAHGRKIINLVEAEGDTAKEDVYNYNILLVEDNAVNQRVLQQMLSKLGCQVVVVENGKQAVNYYKKAHPDLIFMDCQMPVMDGFEATKLIREIDEEEGTHVIIAALTANALESDKERCLGIGMDDFITKPVKIQVIESVLRKWLVGRDDGEVVQNVIEEKPVEEVVVSVDEEVFAELKAIVGDNLGTMVGVYLRTTTTMIEKMNESLSNDNKEDFCRDAHSLKSSSAQMGAMALSVIARRLELEGSEMPQDELEEMYKQLVTEFDTVAKVFEEYVS